jgi:hypothetical protein
VPDQGTLSRLEQVRVENAGLKSEISELKNTTADLRSELARLKIVGGSAVAVGGMVSRNIRLSKHKIICVNLFVKFCYSIL